ncbi:MAG TPA: alkane 1-monooxygenase [Rudaea sp.]|nr:alkane 1-monooxygenase [Rudaea sp.]
MRWRDFGFLMPFGLALLPAAAAASSARGVPADLAAWLPIVVIFGVLPLIDALLGVDTSNIDPEQMSPRAGRTWLRLLPILALPVWLLTLAYCIVEFRQLPLGASGSIGWVLSTGILGGILAINPAHELIHKTGWFERACGGLLLTSVGYHGFKIEHVRGHHVHVATPLDNSTARLGESVYAFVPRALLRNVLNAWRIEGRRLRALGQPAWSWRNEMLGWTALWLALIGAVAVLGGGGAAAFFVAQGLGAAASLEVINYIEHYGLRRAQVAPGRYERVTHLHSWNASQRLSNWLLFNLQRHSDHHARAGRRYPELQHHDDSPQLPAGYATMYVLALVPPLWHRVMDERAMRAAHAGAAAR